MKKIVSILLCVLLVTAMLPLSSTAADAPADPTGGYPVILLPGLLENTLVQNRGEKNEKIVWFDPMAPVRIALRRGLRIVRAIYFGSDEEISYLTNAVIREAVGGIRINPDGTSYEPNVTPILSDARDCSYAALKKNHMLAKVTYGTTMLKDIAAVVGEDRAFVFQYDWRMSPVDIAHDLHDFIADVKAMTGSEKVNISGTSFGAEILLAYLRFYGAQRELHNVLMNSPAYGGSCIFKEMMTATEPTHIEYENLMNMIVSNYSLEAEFGYLLRIIPHVVIDKIFHAAIQDFVKHDFLCSIAFWGCCPHADYEEMKALLLDPTENAAMIAKTDEMQYEVMGRADEILRDASQFGANVYVIMNEGSVLITNHSNGDVLVDAANGTGGVCLEVGEHFPDDYAPERIVCTDRTHNHVSYTGSIDLTNAYLPETTWVFYGQMHGQNYWDAGARALTIRLMTTDEIRDVYSDPAFPQFMETAATVSDVSLSRKDCSEHFLQPKSGTVPFVLTNHSRLHSVLVKELQFDGAAYKTDRAFILLRPGESREINLIPTGDASARYAGVTIVYDEIPNLKLHKSRTQYFEIRE